MPSFAIDGPIATIAFDRPDKRNALDVASWQAIPGLIARASAQTAVRVIVLRGSGGHFAAGADIAEFDEVFANRAATLDYLALMATATASIETAPLPVIAMVEGLCIGAGVAVALSCDIRVAAADAKFAITPAKLGLMYSLADTKRVVDAVGPSATRDLLFTGRMIDAEAALAMRLVDEVHPPTAIAAAVAEKAGQIAGMSSWTHARTKAVVRRIVDGTVTEDDETRGWFADAPDRDDYREGLAAFRARRSPAFPPR